MCLVLLIIEQQSLSENYLKVEAQYIIKQRKIDFIDVLGFKTEEMYMVWPLTLV